MRAENTLLILLAHVCQGTIPYHRREWNTLYMDDSDKCDSPTLTINDDMSEGDVYVVMSDRWHGESTWSNQLPAECTHGFNFGDRLVSVDVIDWRCDGLSKDPFLAIYDDCDLQRRSLLASFNCSSPQTTKLIFSTGSCATIYHYRGHTKYGYFFKVEIIARHEVVAFPAGGIAAIIITSIVVLMVLVKIVCIITGYESRLPDIDLDTDDEHKQILDNATEPIIQDSDGPGSSDSPSRPSQTMVVSSTSRHGAHTVLTVTRSTGSTGRAGTSADYSSDYDYDLDYDFLDAPTTPTLKRIPSGRATNIWSKQ